jgi:RNA polymerase sigma factor (sigma-70 family)
VSNNVAGAQPSGTGSQVYALDDARSDAELINAVRRGVLIAYGTLFTRHRDAAVNLAQQLARCPADADELVAEAFAKVLLTLRKGRGPTTAFRAYLLTTLRHTAYDRTRRAKKIDLVDDVVQADGVSAESVSVPFIDTALAKLERSMAAKGFEALPERWQAVLWLTEIEGLSPGEVAPRLGMTANAVSALAYRARAGLRTAYLQAHLSAHVRSACRSTAEQLAAYLRGSLGKRARAAVSDHLDGCARCRQHLAQLGDLNTEIPA